MTVAIAQSKVIYTGNGQTIQWDIPFPFLSKEDLKVYIKEANGTLTLLTNQYSIDENSAVLTYPVAGNGVPALDSTQKLIIVRNTPRTQETDLAAQATIDPDALEGNDDKAMLVCQELTEEVGRCLKFPVDSAVNGDDPATYLVNISSVVSTVQDAVEEVQDAVEEVQDAVEEVQDAVEQAQEYAEISQSANINKVSKTGDTMSGNLQISNTAPRYLLENSTLQAGTAPAETAASGMVALDKDDTQLGSFLHVRNTSGACYTEIASKNAAATSQTAIQVGYDENGAVFTQCPTPASASNTTEIATTAWVRGYAPDKDLSNLSASGKEKAANFSFPSTQSETLSTGTSGTSYTATADGFVVARATGSTYLQINDTTADLMFAQYSWGTTGTLHATAMIAKGHSYTVNYNGTLTSHTFVYAQGEAA